LQARLRAAGCARQSLAATRPGPAVAAPEVEGLKVYPAGVGRLVVHVPDGRGEELRLHLASHGVLAKVSPPAQTPFERVEVEGADAESLQALVDQWER